MEDKKLKIIIEAIDKASQVVKGMADKVKKAGTTAKDAFKGASTGTDKLKKSVESTGNAFSQLGMKAKTALTGAAAPVNKLGQAFTDVKGKIGGMVQSMGGIGMAVTAASTAYMALSMAMGKVVQAFKSIINSAIEQEAVLQRLQFTLADIGQAGTEVEEKVMGIAGALQELTGFGDEDFYEIFNKLALSVGDADVAMKATLETVMLMKGAGTRQKATIEALAMAYMGQAEKLAALTPLMMEYYEANKDIMTETELTTGMIKLLNKEYGDFVNRQDTAGKLAELGQEWDDIKKILAEGVLPAVSDLSNAMSGLNSIVAGSIKWVNDLGKKFDELDKKIGGPYKKFKEWKELQKEKIAEMPGGKETNTVVQMLTDAFSGKGLYAFTKPLVEAGKKQERMNEYEAKKLLALQRYETRGLTSTGKGKFDVSEQMQQLQNDITILEYKKKQNISTATRLKMYEELLQKGKEMGAVEAELIPLISTINSMRNSGAASQESAQKKRADAEKKSHDAAMKAHKDEIAAAHESVRVAQEQARVEQQISEARVAGLQEGIEIERGRFQVERGPDAYSIFESQAKESAAETEKYREKNAQLLSVDRGMRAEIEILQRKSLLLSQLQNVSGEQAEKIMKEITNLNRQYTKDQEQTNRLMLDSMRDAAEINIAYNELVGMQADITRYQERQRELSSGLIVDAGERARIMQSQTGFITRIAEQFGVTKDHADGLLSKLMGMNEEEIKLMETTANFDEQLKTINKQYRTKGFFGLEDQKSYADEMVRFYEAKLDELSKKKDAYQLVGEAQALTYWKQIAESAESAKAIKKGGEQIAESLDEPVKSALSGALRKGFDEGGKSAIQSFAESLKNAIKDKAAEGLADAMMGGGGAGGGLFNMFKDGGGAAGGGTTTAAGTAMQIASSLTPLGKNAPQRFSPPGSFVKGWTQMGVKGGLIPGGTGITSLAATGGTTTGAGVGIASGAGGLLSKVSPYIGIALLLGGMLKKGGGSPMSGVSALPTQATTMIGGNLDVLRGSESFTRSAFRSENVEGALSASRVETRLGEQHKVSVTVEPSPMFDVQVEDRLVSRSQISDQGGSPNRSGFTNG